MTTKLGGASLQALRRWRESLLDASLPKLSVLTTLNKLSMAMSMSVSMLFVFSGEI